MDTGDYSYDCEPEDDYDLEEITIDVPSTFHRMKSQSSMIFLKLDDIKRVLDKRIEELQELLDTSYDETLILFHFFNWNRDKLENSDWFLNQEDISRRAGLIPPTNQQFVANPNECPICMGEFSQEDLDGLKCRHLICKNCWDVYINDHVNFPDNEFFWKCPGQIEGISCNLVIPDSFNRKFLRKENETKYTRKLCISFVEENKAIRWCPAPNCIYCVENPSLVTRTIKCRCSTIFCFKCGLEDHQPCSCQLAAKWSSKNIEESENTKWISVYTKTCPKCSKPIEKNQGCNHMTCKHKGCNYEFCWLCLEEWKTHQGGHYKCNKYDGLNEEEKRSMNSHHDSERKELEKYVFYFERFSNSERAFQMAKELHYKMELNVKELHDKLNLPYSEINFLNEATEILQKTRKLLKWTYVYAYYLNDQKSKNLFEFHQKDLERYCEELNEALEMNYSKSIQNNQGVVDLKAFLAYKDKVSNSYFKCQKFYNEISRVVEEESEKF